MNAAVVSGRVLPGVGSRIIALLWLLAPAPSLLAGDLVFENGFEPCEIFFPDSDGDGFGDATAAGLESCAVLPDLVANSLDCDDGAASINPDAPEICGDAIDNDCSGVADDLDFDMDGFVAEACYGDDIDDSDPVVGKLSGEQCFDNVDNDNNGLVDLEDPVCAPNCDVDMDGNPSVACGGTDQDDEDATIFAGADEVCGDFKDNDQDGVIDEDCLDTGIALGPEGVVMVSGDVREFLIVDSEPRVVDWVFSANGVEGGNAQVGTVVTLSSNSSRARYTAPDVTTQTAFTLTATDANDPALSDSTSVTVIPVDAASIEVNPAMPTIGLGIAQRFAAEMSFGAGPPVRLRAVVWKVNGMVGGSPELGTIGPDGLYQAPGIMPGPLPVQIDVGFSFSLDGPVIASTPILLARLDAAPRFFESNAAGPAGQITTTLSTSDGMQVMPGAGSLVYSTDDRDIATSDVNGNVSVGQNTGRTFIRVTDPLSGAFDDVQVNSLPQVELTVDAVPLLDEYVRIEKDALGGATEIEFTRPQTQFQFRPRFRYLRGQKQGEELSGLTSEFLTISADGVDIIDYDPADGVPQPTGVVAVVNRVSGIVDIGDVSGSGTITATYDDGLVQATHAVTVMFTRPTMTVTVRGTVSESNTDIFNTEYIDVKVELSNPLTGYVGVTPILLEVSNEQMDAFRIAYQLSVTTGTGQFVRFDSVNPTTSEIGNSVTLDVPSTLMTDGSGFPLDPVINFRIVPGEPGVHTITTTISNDPAVTEQKQVNVVQPMLTVGQCQFGGFSGSDSGGTQLTRDENGDPFERLDDTPLLLDTWTPLALADGGFPGPVLERELDGQAVWRFLQGGTEQLVVPTRFRRSPFDPFGDPPTLSMAGFFDLVAGPADRPSLDTAPFVVESVTAASVAGRTLDPKTSSGGTSIPRDWQLGSFEVVSLPSSWTDLEPMTIVLQSYNANGVPATVGYTKFRLVDDGSGGMEKQEIGDFVYGVFVDDASQSGPFPTGGPDEFFPADDTGRIEIDITPKVSDTFRDDPELFAREVRRPFVLKVHPYLSIGGGTYTTLPELEEGPQLDDFLPHFSDGEHKRLFEGYLRPCLYIPGNGLLVHPPAVPVPSQRVRDAVTAGELPARAEQTVFTLYGPGEDFAAAAASGIDTAASDFGDGLTVQSTQLDAMGRLEVTATTTVDTVLDERELTVVFNNGDEWRGDLTVFRKWYEKSSIRLDENMPLNAVAEAERVPGSMVLIVDRGIGPRVRTMDLELMPSIVAADAGNPGNPDAVFRTAEADQPLVGFARLPDPDTELPKVRGTQVRNYSESSVRLYGNVSDDRTLSDGVLSAPGNPDGLPDFVSRSEDAEVFTATLYDNWADIQYFTAYNVVAEEQSIEPAQIPELDFALLRTGPLLDVYSAYSSTGSSAPTWSEAGADLDRRIGVLVDHEARSFAALDGEANHLNGIVPISYWAGVLDQYYLLETPDNYTRQPQISIGKDGRVGGFDGEFGGVATGVDRTHFGVELDGVLYENDLFGFQEPPNSATLLQIPVVDIGASSTVLTPNDLLPDAGGTSGGFIDFETGTTRVQAQSSVSKTPGQRAPGLVAGYLIQDRPSDFPTPITNSVENDAFRLALQRNYEPSANDAFGAPLAKEREGFFDFAERRRLMTFGSDFDRKGPINSATKVLHEFLITTDPPGLPPVRVKGVLDVRELEATAPETRLFVTTQSDGSEGQQKVFLDSATDLAVEAVGAVIMTAISAGGYLELCSQDILGELAGEAMDIAVGTVDLAYSGDGLLGDYVEPEKGRKAFLVSYGALAGGVNVPYTEGTGIQFDLKSVVAGGLEAAREEGQDGKKRFVGLDRTKVAKLGRGMAICKLVRAPITATKAAIKEFTTIERLGGKGAAEALGIKSIAVSIPREAQLPDSETATGTYNFFYNYQRRIDVRPREAFVTPQSDSTNFNFDPSTVSDRDLVQQLIAGAANPATRNDAGRFLNRLAVGGVRREIPESSAFDGVYHPYTLRSASMNTLQLFIVPGEQLGSGNQTGDFAFTTGTSKIPVSTLGVATVSRSNANATARAVVHFGDVRLVLRGAMVLRD